MHYKFITGTNQVCSITDKFVLLSGSVFYKRAKLTGVQYKQRVIFTFDDSITIVIYFLNPIIFIRIKSFMSIYSHSKVEIQNGKY